MEKQIGNTTVHLDQEGYLTDFNEWNESVAEALAREKGITLTDKHWEVIRFVREKFQKGEPLSIRSIKKSGVVDVKEFYELFPGGPLKTVSLIAGIPKPKSCI